MPNTQKVNTPERKKYLAELNEIALYTGEILHGEELTKVRVKQLKKYFNKTYKMLHRLCDMKGDINNNSFKFGYGGKRLVRIVLIELGVIEKLPNNGRKVIYKLLLPEEELDLELVSRIIVEVYLKRHDIDPI